MNAGQATIEWLCSEQLHVDEEWAVHTPDGFRWWAGEHAQTIEVVGQDSDEADETGYHVAVRTELFRSVTLDDRTLVALNQTFMQAASMSGPVFDGERRTLTLCSLVRVHKVIASWLRALLSMASVLQLAEAIFVAPRLALVMGAELATSAHPHNGVRAEPDAILGVLPQLVIPAGARESRWTTGEIEAAFGAGAGSLYAFPEGLDGNALVVQVPFTDLQAVCHLRGDASHPGYGHGLLLLQSFPLTPPSEAESVRLALLLNEMELTQMEFGYGFGSHAYRDGGMWFSTFFPNALHDQIRLENLFASCAVRARMAAMAVDTLAGE